MATFDIQPIGTQVQPIQGMKLSDMMNLASTAQAYQQAQKLNPLQVQNAQQQVQQQQMATQKAQMGLAGDRMKAIVDSQVSMINNPLVVQAEQDPSSVDPRKLAELVQKNSEQTANALGIPVEQARSLTQPYIEMAMTNPSGLRNYYKEKHLQGLDAAARTSAMTPTMREVTGFAPDGTKYTEQRNVNPFAGPVGAPIGGTQSFAGPGQVMTPTNRTDPATGAPTAFVTDSRSGKIVEVTIPAGIGGAGATGGEQPINVFNRRPPAMGGGMPDLNQPAPAGAGSQAARDAAAQGTPPPPAPAYGAPTRLTPGQEAMRDIELKTAQTDWQDTQFKNQAAQPRIASLQKIKALVPAAFTGVGADRQKMLSSLAQTIGLPVAVMETAKTEELAKNSALLQLAGGNTDAARSIAELANPNTKMTKQGILAVTDQLIGLERMNQAKQQFLAPVQNDATQYMQNKQAFDNYADPRMFQESSPEAVAEMKKAMSPKEREEFAAKIKKARQLGII